MYLIQDLVMDCGPHHAEALLSLSRLKVNDFDSFPRYLTAGRGSRRCKSLMPGHHFWAGPSKNYGWVLGMPMMERKFVSACTLPSTTSTFCILLRKYGRRCEISGCLDILKEYHLVFAPFEGSSKSFQHQIIVKDGTKRTLT